LNQNILFKYIFRKDLFWKIKEKINQFIRNNFKNGFKDQRELLKNIESGVILDVGAHIGDTVKLYRNYFPGYKIFCFEPFPESCDYMKRRFINDSNINVIETALGIKDETIPLYLSSFSNLNSLQRPNERAWGFDKKQTIDVKTITLDQFYKESDFKHIDILKLDVQGSELDVLIGSKTLLEKSLISLIYIEWQVVPLYENHTTYFKIADYLVIFGYEFIILMKLDQAR